MSPKCPPRYSSLPRLALAMVALSLAAPEAGISAAAATPATAKTSTLAAATAATATAKTSATLAAATPASLSPASPQAETRAVASPLPDGLAPVVGFLGDSISTGGATHDRLKFDAGALGAVFQGNPGAPLDPAVIQAFTEAGFPAAVDDPQPRFLMPSRREFRGGLDWVFRHASRRFAQFYLDTPAYSWSMLTARQRGFAPGAVLLGAEDGARMEVLNRQIDRVLDANGAQIPDELFIFFTGNDLCGQTMAQVTSAEEYGQRLYDGLVYLVRNGRPSPRGTRVWVLHPLSILQLVQSEPILAKPIRAHGRDLTCKALHASTRDAVREAAPTDWASLGPETAFVMQMMPQRPGDYCPTLFTKEWSGALANRIRSYRDQIDAAVTRFTRMLAQEGASGLVTVDVVKSPANVLFDAADIANDCFHLSPYGQLKVARAVREEIGAPAPSSR